MSLSNKTTLIRGRWIFTGQNTINDGAIAVRGDTILELGSWEILRAAYPQAVVCGSSQHAVLPGLINAHHHSNGVAHSLQGVEDDFLELWLFANNMLRSQDPYLKTMLSVAALLQSGVTTVVDVASVSGSSEEAIANLNGRLQAYEQAGMRVALAPGASYDSFLVHGEDAAFLNHLPATLRQQLQTLLPLEQTLTPDAYIEIMSELVCRYQTHPTLKVWFGPPGPQWVGDDMLVKLVDIAARLDTNVQTHAVESFYEKLIGPRFYGKSVIAHLHELGVLDSRFSIAHGVWVNEQDIEILATTRAAVSHNPSSNLRLRAGIAPLNQLLAAGVTVGLGMDGTTLGDDEDMFAEMRLAARLHRSPQLNTPAPSYEDIFHMATTYGAKLLRQEQRIGKLAAGYKADVVLVKCDRLTWPWLAPEVNPLHVILMRAKALDVDMVWVNGNLVLKDGQPTRFDLKAVGRAIAEQLTASPNRHVYRTLSQELLPHLTHWYRQWDIPKLEPYSIFNSRF
jgi:cytosine/adenosine deaminase-related metal-dependent hydrolase